MVESITLVVFVYSRRHQTSGIRQMVASGVLTHVRDSSAGEGQPNYLVIGVYRRCCFLVLDTRLEKWAAEVHPQMHPSVFAEQFTHSDTPPIMII